MAPAGANFSLVRDGELFFLALVAGRYEVEVYNPGGIKVARFPNHDLNQSKNRLYLGQIPAGVYLVRITQPDSGVTVKRAMVIR